MLNQIRESLFNTRRLILSAEYKLECKSAIVAFKTSLGRETEYSIMYC